MHWGLYLLSPVYQTLLFLLLTPVIILLVRPNVSEKAWLVAMYVYVLFLIVNAIMLWFNDDSWTYFFYSLGCSVGYLLLVAVVMKGVLKVLNLRSSEEGAMAFLVLIYQPAALLLVIGAKWIVHR